MADVGKQVWGYFVDWLGKDASNFFNDNNLDQIYQNTQNVDGFNGFVHTYASASWTYRFGYTAAKELRPVDLSRTKFDQQYIGNHIILNASDTILA